MWALKTAWKYDTVMLQRNQAEPNTVCFHSNNTHAYILHTPVKAGCNSIERQMGRYSPCFLAEQLRVVFDKVDVRRPVRHFLTKTRQETAEKNNDSFGVQHKSVNL